MKNTFKYLTLILSFTFLHSCATPSIPMEGLKQDQNAKQFQASTDNSRIYIYRESKFVGSLVKIPVYINGKVVGQSSAGTYFVLEVNPGDYRVGCLAGENSEVNLSVKKGEIAYVEHQAIMGAFVAGCEVKEVTADVAQPAILNTKRARVTF